MRNNLFAAAIACALFLSQTACGAENPRTVQTQTGPIAVDVVASGLNDPWAVAFLPDGRMLVVVTPGRALGYRAEDGDLRWIVTARKNCAFRPDEAPPVVDRLLLLAQDCADPDLPWHLRTVPLGEQGRIKPPADRRPEK